MAIKVVILAALLTTIARMSLARLTKAKPSVENRTKEVMRDYASHAFQNLAVYRQGTSYLVDQRDVRPGMPDQAWWAARYPCETASILTRSPMV